MEHGSPNPDAAFPGLYRFGDVEVDVAAHTLKRGGEPCAIEPKAFAVLLALLRRPGELVGHDELLDGVWGHRHVTPGVLTRAIAQLRGALGDDSHHPRYIQTRHALGYSFIGELVGDGPSPVAEAEAAAPGLPVEVPSPMPVAAAVATAPPEARSHHWPLRYWFAASMVAVVFAVAMFVKERAGDGSRVVAPTVAVMPFANIGPDRDTDYFAQGLAVEMHAALAGVEGLRVAALPEPDGSGERESDVRTLGRRLGVAAVLDASVRREGDRLRINARLSDTRNGYTLWSHTYERGVDDIFATQEEIAREVVLALLGSVRLDRSAMEKRLAPTSSYAAFDSYLRGNWLLQRASGDEDVAKAIGYFQDALSRDAGFARAQLAICNGERWRFVNMRDAAAYERALAACTRAAEMDPDLAEVDLELGDLMQARGDTRQARDHYERATRHRALLPDVYVRLGELEAVDGREEDALAYYRRALALRDGDAKIHGRVGYQQYLAGDIPGATVSFRRAAELSPDDEGLWGTLGGLYLAAGDHDAARDAFQRSIAVRPTDAALNNYGELRLLEGDFAGAAALFKQALDVDDADFLIWGNLANALQAQPEQADQAAGFYVEAAHRARRYLELDPGNAQALAALGWYEASLGHSEEAVELASRASSLAPGNAEVALLNAQTYARAGDVEAARVQVALARKAGISAPRLASNPFLSGILNVEDAADGRPSSTPPPHGGPNRSRST